MKVWARGLLVLLIVAALAVALTSCGSDDGGGVSAEAQAALEAAENSETKYEKEHPGTARFGSPPLEFEADPNGALAYTEDEVTALEGNKTLEFTNPQSTPHNLVMEELPSHGKVETETVEEGFAATTITFYLGKKYVYYCSIPGHREAGMEGIVRVKPNQ